MKLINVELQPYTYNGGGFDILCKFDGNEASRIAERKMAKFEERQGLYRADVGDVVRYFYWTSPGDGYGGAVFEVDMIDGTHRSLKGPWSSRAGCVNRVFPEMAHIIECIDVTDGYRVSSDVKIASLARFGLGFVVKEDSSSDFTWALRV